MTSTCHTTQFPDEIDLLGRLGQFATETLLFRFTVFPHRKSLIPERQTMQRTDSQCLTYSALAGEQDLSLVFAYRSALADKSVVATFRWIPFDKDDDKSLKLGWSKQLDSYFIYAPKSDGAALVNAAKIQLPSRGDLEIRLLNWPSMSPIDSKVVSGLFARTRSTMQGKTFFGLELLKENGSAS